MRNFLDKRTHARVWINAQVHLSGLTHAFTCLD